MRSAIIVFTKVPRPGHTKTRLTQEKGGLLTPEEARDFYAASLLDVVEACIAARTGDVYICHECGGDRELLRDLLSTVADARLIKDIFADEGGTFDQAMQYAADYVLRQGGADRLADGMIIVGGDSPGLQPAVIKDAVRKMEVLAASERGIELARDSFGPAADVGAAVVTSVDQEAGFNLIGYTCTTPITIDGLFYNPEGITALDMLIQKAARQQIPFGVVDMIPDVDLPVDLASMIPAVQSLALAERFDPAVKAPKRTLQFIADLGLQCSAWPSS